MVSLTARQIEPSMIQKKREVGDWFRNLRDDICNIFEGIEDAGNPAGGPAGRFKRKTWQRDGGGGGEMSLMHGRVFEKVGVNVSTVHGVFSEKFKNIARPTAQRHVRSSLLPPRPSTTQGSQEPASRKS